MYFDRCGNIIDGFVKGIRKLYTKGECYENTKENFSKAAGDHAYCCIAASSCMECPGGSSQGKTDRCFVQP